jgi:ankyrin repeat protein
VKTIMLQRRTSLFGILLASLVLSGSCVGPQTPLGKAVSRGDRGAVQELLKGGADPCVPAGRGDYTPLDLAGGSTRDIIWKDELKDAIYADLLDAAFAQVAAGRQCEHLLQYAARVGDVEKIRQLIDLGWNVDLGREEWETSALGIAAYYGQEQAAAVLVAAGADAGRQIENFERMRSWAASIGKESSVHTASAAIHLLNKLQEPGDRHTGVAEDHVTDQEHVQ